MSASEPLESTSSNSRHAPNKRRPRPNRHRANATIHSPNGESADAQANSVTTSAPSPGAQNGARRGVRRPYRGQSNRMGADRTAGVMNTGGLDVGSGSISQPAPSQSDAGKGNLSSSTRSIIPVSAPSEKQQGGGSRIRRDRGQDRASALDVGRESSGTPRPGRRSRFNANLTDAHAKNGQDVDTSASTSSKPSEKDSMSAPKKDDLTTILIHNLRTPPYPDCPICFSAIHPREQTWSCSSSLPVFSSTNESPEKENENTQCCWTTFHLKCIRSWASKSVKEVAEAWRARGEHRDGEWRCPGCQSKRTVVPSGYWCFCGSAADPKPPRLATPHSCASPCSRPRICGHACPLSCHPGPCPPCLVTIQKPCYCRHQVLSYRCSNLHPSKNKTVTGQVADLSCGKVCGKRLGCGNHTCKDICHYGDCEPCSVRETAKCYCGKEEKELGCGEGSDRSCVVKDSDSREEKWTGRFECKTICGRPFDCGIHHCPKSCHPPSPEPPLCPFSPSLVTHCPCGKHPLSDSSASAFRPGTILSRTACTDRVPTCNSICMKSLAGCSHVCSERCHTGPCPPCSIMIVRPCRCGATTRDVKCSQVQKMSNDELLCDRPCQALRACGRHQCNRLCCPLASLGGFGKGKGKKRAMNALDNIVVADEMGLHECDLVCGKLLGCGNHHCEERDHKGLCPPCLRSSFDEMICHCGRTVLEPPIPCGTRINCTNPCTRPALPCGHPKAPHTCHEDPTPCPPCPFLTTKRCACGKKMVDNIRCSQEKVSCGTVCGRLLGCGFHHCERLCHGEQCGSCSAPCGKPRKLCLPSLHPCTESCHAPASCPETDPCRATITLACPCGRIRQPVPCGRSTSNPAGREGTQQLKCSNECLVAKRNARLAEALGIDVEKHDKVTYSDELIASARGNIKFCNLVEKTFAEFVNSDKKTQVLPHMPPDRRQFVHDLASIYRMDTQMVDQEPHRSVQLIRRVDTRIPTSLLSAVAASSSSNSSSNLGKLADLRAPPPSQNRTFSPTHSVASSASSGSRRGWTSVVSRPSGPTVPAAPNGSRGPTPGGRSAAASNLVQSTVAPPWLRQSNPNVQLTAPVPDDWEEDV